jgi:hypothetical protein
VGLDRGHRERRLELDTGSDFVGWVGDIASDVGGWIEHNADVLGAIALDALEMIGGALATVGGGALIAAGRQRLAASMPLVLTGAGAASRGARVTPLT